MMNLKRIFTFTPKVYNEMYDEKEIPMYNKLYLDEEDDEE